MQGVGRQWLEWLTCSAVHYSGLDRWIGPLHRRAGDMVSIVMYHRVHPDGPGPSWRLTQSVFRAQLEHLTRHYRVLSLDQVVDTLAAGEPLPARAVVVTFDDGYRDNYTQAFPVIQDTQCPTTIFLTAGLIDTHTTLWWDEIQYVVQTTGCSHEEVDRVFRQHDLPMPDWRGPDVEAAILELKKRTEGVMQEETHEIARALGVDPESNVNDYMMTWTEAREMADSGLVTMGAHTMTHRNLKKISLEDARDEIGRSKSTIEDRLERPVDLFAYPFGNPANDYTDEVKAIVRDSGYRCAVTVVLGLAERGVDLFEIPRFCESAERWQAPHGGFSRAVFDAYVTGARDHLGDLRPDRWLKRSA